MNPEIRRHAWLDLGWHRLLIAPLVIAALAAIPLATSANPAQPLAWGASGLFLVLTIGWGSLRALASVSDEVRDRTWDFQRMAATTAADLALGKVFGAPLYQWYAGAWCLAVFVVAGTRAGLANVGNRALTLVAGAVLLHALAVALSAAGARLPVGGRARRGTAILSLLALLQFAPFALLSGAAGDAQSFVRWWSWRLSLDSFVAVSAVAFAFWALLAAWRTMSRELREPMRPWAWPAFAAFSALWWAGISTPGMDRPAPGQVLAVAALVLVFGSYVAVLLDPLTPVTLARLRRAWRERAAEWQQRVPAWAVNALLAAMLGGLALALGRGTPLASAALPIALVAVRDVAVVGTFGLLSPSRSPVGRAVFYLAVADLLLPGLAFALQQPGLARACFPLLALVGDPQHSALPGAAVHAVVALAALALAVRRAGRVDGATG
jgi:hypothetical protein